MKIAYLIDSPSCLNKDNLLANENDLFMINYEIELDKKRYIVSTINNIHQDSLYKMIETSKQIKSLLPSYEQIDNLLKKIKASGYDTLVTSLIGSGLSNLQNLVYQIALENKLTIIQLDCKGVGPLQIEAINKFKIELQKGRSLIYIKNKVDHMLAKSECYFIAKDINGLATTNNVKTKNNIFIKSRLDFKILLECDKVSGGKLKEITSMKGDRKIIESMLELALCNIEPTEYHFYIGHYGDIEMAKVCEDLLLLKYPRADYSHIALNDSIGAFIQSNSLCFFTIRK